MRRLPLLHFFSFLPLATALLFASDERDAAACGGCFVPPVQVDRTVVTDHRMAFAITHDKTILWDQIRYSGDPREFAWVLPVKPGAELQLSNDAWFAALDASTQPIVTSPAYYGGGYGCALTGCGSSGDSTSGADPGAGQVQILSQHVVGPYETVTLRATDPKALETWLTQHAFAIPDAIKPTIDQYVAESFDFIALRLVPTCNERSMRPVRIVTPGADASLPLRMVAAGIGAKVGITLYVIGEGRYRPQNFPEVLLDDSALEWNRAQNRSNYDELSQSLMAQANGHSWLTEYANHPNLYDPGVGYGYPGSSGYYSNTNNPGLAEAYFSQCRPRYGGSGGTGTGTGGQPQPCTAPPDDAGADSATTFDAGTLDASDVDAAANDGGATSDGGIDDAATADAAARDSGAASTDSGTPHFDAGAGSACEGFDDLDVAIGNLHPNDVWVTRLRAVLPTDALKIGDLRLQAAPSQSYVSNFHQTTRYTDETGKARSGCASGTGKHEPFSLYVVLGVAALAIGGAIRRRVRK